MPERREKGELKHGIKVGERIEKDFEVRSLTTGEMFECARASESLQHVIVGFDDNTKPIYKPAYIESPAEMGRQTMLKRLVCIGSLEGPFSNETLKTLDEEDGEIILNTIELMQSALPEVALEMGRTVESGEEITPGDQ